MCGKEVDGGVGGWLVPHKSCRTGQYQMPASTFPKLHTTAVHCGEVHLTALQCAAVQCTEKTCIAPQ